MDAIRLVRSRRSIRKFKPTKVQSDVIRTILELARWAPSAHNAQPWRLVVIDDDEVKKTLADEMSKAWLDDMHNDGVPKGKAERIAKRESLDRITRSPVVVMACLTMEGMHRYRDSRRRKAEYIMATQSVAAYIQTMLLLASYYELGTCWSCAPLFCQNAVRKALGLPRKLEPHAMITMGYADKKPKPTLRRALDKTCAFNSWPNVRGT